MEQLGKPGLYQIILCISLSVCISTTSMNHLAMITFGYAPTHSCKLPSGILKKDAIPKAPLGGFEQCLSYSGFNKSTSNTTISCSAGWEFANNGETSIVTEWSLVCDNKYLVNTATTIYFAGVMVGGILFGQLADKVGRKPILLFCMYGHILLSFLIYFVESYAAFVALRFFVGFLIQGLQTTAYVLLIEMTVLKYRPIFAGISEVFWGLGIFWLASLSWIVTDWRNLQLALCLPSLITVYFIVFLPESLRWLVLEKKNKQALKTVSKIASFNKIILADDLEIYVKKQPTKGDGGMYSFHDLFLTPNIRKRTLLLCYIWFVCSISYYGLSLSIGGLAGDRHLNLFITAMLELFALSLTILTLKYLPRRIPLVCYFIFGGIVCIIAGAIKSSSLDNKKEIAAVLAIGGRFFISAAFATCFLYTAELFPTVVRSIGMATCLFWARVGGIIAPQILLIGNYTFNELPFLLIGGLSLLAGVAAYFVPETRGVVLPDTIEAIEETTNNLLNHDEDQDNLTKSYSTC